MNKDDKNADSPLKELTVEDLEKVIGGEDVLAWRTEVRYRNGLFNEYSSRASGLTTDDGSEP